MYALSVSAEGDCYRCVLPDPGIAAAALGASESGTLPSTAPAQALHTFTLDSGASRCFFRDSTTLTPLPAPVPVRLADPSGGPVFARSSTVLPCLAVSSDSLSDLHLPSFSTNLVSTAALQDAMVTTTTPGGQRVTICTCIRTGRHLATFTRRPGLKSSMAPPPWSPLPATPSCMHSRLLVSGLPRSLPPLPPSPAPPCLPCVEGRQRAAPHSSSFPPTAAPLQTLHMDVWGPARVSGQSRERYFLLVVDDYMQYTTVFPLRSKGQVVDVLIPWIRTVHLQLRERFGQDLPVLRLHSDRGAPHWLSHGGRSYLHDPCGCSPFFVAVCGPGSRAFVPDTSTDKLSHRAIPCVFLGFVPDAPGWQFYHPTSRRVFSSQDITFDKSVPFYHLFPYRSAPPLPPPLFLAPGPPPVDPLPPQGPAPSGVSQVDPLSGPAPVQVAVGSGAARGAASGGAAFGVAEPGGVESEGAGSGGAEPGGREPGGAEPVGVEPEGAEPGGVESEGVEPVGVEPKGAKSGGAEPRAARAGGAIDTGAEGAGVTAGAGGTGGTAATGPGGARTRGTGAAGTGGVEGTGAGDPTEPGATRAGGTGAGGAGAGGAGAPRAGAVDPGAGGVGDTVRPQPYFVPLLQQVLGVPSSTGLTPPLLRPPPDQSQLPLQPASPLPAPSPYTEQSGGLTERREPASHSVSPVRTARRIPRSRPPAVPNTHAMALRPSSVPLRVPLLAPLESSLSEVPDPEYDRAHAASPTVARLLATAVTDPSFESAATSALVAELLDFAAACRLDYATALVAESEFASPPSVGGECALGTNLLEDRQEDFECLAAAVPCFASMLLAPEGDPDAPDISTLRSYAESITGPYSSQWQAAMDAEMASWKSTGTYVDEVPPPGANIVDGMWIFRRDYELHSLDFSTAFLQGSLQEQIWLRRPTGFTELFPAGTQWSLRRPVYDLRQAPREWHDTLRTTLAALGFAPATANPSLFLRTDTSLPPFYVLVYVDDLVFATAYTEALTLVKSELQKRHTCTDLGPSALWLPVLLATAHSSVYRPLALSSTFGRVPFWLATWLPAEIYAGAMAAQELRWLTYLLTDLVEQPRSPPIPYVDNKAMIAFCQEHRLEHRTKHIALRYFLARELQQRGQLRLAYVASRANTADVFTKALPLGDHQRFATVLRLVPTLPHLLTT
ncbi:unnamed protein product [Closterium sp. NIES-53]